MTPPQGSATVFCIPPQAFPPPCGGSLRFAQLRLRRILVEPMGFEPTTSSMPSRRAPNCATAPPPRNAVLAFIALRGAQRQTNCYATFRESASSGSGG